MPVDGEAQEATVAEGTEGTPPAGTPAPTPTPPSAPAAPAQEAPPVGDDKGGETKLTAEAAEKLIADLRREAANHRNEKQTARQERDDLINKVALALGLKEDAPKPEQLQGQVTKLADENRRLHGELLVLKESNTHNLNPELAAAVLLHRGVLAQFNPEDKASVDALKAEMKTLADTMPALRTTPAPPQRSGGAPPAGGQGAEPTSLAEALRQRLQV